MFIISFIIGCLFGWYIAYKKYAKTRVQINKPYSQGNIQIGSINVKDIR